MATNPLIAPTPWLPRALRGVGWWRNQWVRAVIWVAARVRCDRLRRSDLGHHPAPPPDRYQGQAQTNQPNHLSALELMVAKPDWQRLIDQKKCDHTFEAGIKLGAIDAFGIFFIVFFELC